MLSVYSVHSLASMSVAAQDPKSFGLAVLRRDGVMVPFGSYTGRNWTSDWPGGDENLTLPITLNDIPRKSNSTDAPRSMIAR